MRLLALSLGLVGGIACQSSVTAQTDHAAPRVADSRPENESVRRIAQSVARILPSDEARAAIAVIEDGRATRAFAGNPSVSSATLFEMGSITKVLTANLVMQRALNGELDLEVGIDALPGGQEIGDGWSERTLRDLLTHASGLSAWPPNWGPVRIFFAGQLGDPFAPYDAADLVAGMRRTRGARKQDSAEPEWLYSNYGFAVLGHVLEAQAGRAYATIAQEGFIGPIGLRTATLDGWSGEDIAPPLGRRGGAATNWTFRAFAPAGALRGNLNDAVGLLRHAIEACDQQDSASVATCAAQRPAGFRMNDESEMGLGWVRTRHADATIVWHNGGTGGYSSFLGFSPERDKGIVILTNVGFLREIDDLARSELVR